MGDERGNFLFFLIEELIQVATARSENFVVKNILWRTAQCFFIFLLVLFIFYFFDTSNYRKVSFDLLLVIIFHKFFFGEKTYEKLFLNILHMLIEL